MNVRRTLVHVSMVLFALAIGRLAAWQISLCCLIALLFNLFLLPNLSRGALETSEDKQRGYSIGMLLYPFSLLLLSFFFWSTPVYMAIGWGAMAFGDASAAVMGRKWGGIKWPWNPDKSILGSLAFWVVGSLLTFGLLILLPQFIFQEIPLHTWFLAITSALLIAALIESLPGLIDDNLSVPITAAFSAFFIMEAFYSPTPTLPENWIYGMAATTFLTVGSIFTKKIDLIGAFAGGLICWLMFLGGNWLGVSLLFAFFVLGSGVTLVGRKQKKAQQLAHEVDGKRSLRHALANGGVAATCGLLAWYFPENQHLFLVMMAASLAAAASDTFSSELGMVYGTRHWDILSFRKGRRGNDGVISLEGSLAGVLGAGLMGTIVGIAMHDWQLTLLVTAAGILGNLADSIMGATLQRRDFMTNDTVNFANTLVAAVLIYVIRLIFFL